jgi:NitT/TauT family transport system substrate-binding protein
MKKNALLGLVVIVVIGIAIAFLFLKPDEQRAEAQSFTITKAWWPVWDTFQIGVQRYEKGHRSFQTTFLQEKDYVSALEKFQEKDMDAATLTIFEAIHAASEGTTLKIVLLLDYTIGSDGMVAKKDIRSLLDLKGKRIGIEKGSIGHFTVLKALEAAGLKQSEVELVDLDLEGLKQAFLKDEVVAAGIYEPYMSDWAQQGNGHVIFSSREFPQSICDVLFVKESIARENPEVIDYWIHSWNEVLVFRRNATEDYLRILNGLNGTPVQDLKSSFEGIFFTNLSENRIAFGTPERPGYLLDSLVKMQDFMLKEGVIKKRISLRDLIYFDGIQRFFKN